MKRNILFSLLLCFLQFTTVGCSYSKEEKDIVKEYFTDISLSVIADDKFNAKAYINLANDGVFVTLKNGFDRNLRAINVETKQYNENGKEVATTNKLVEYLLDEQDYICEVVINKEDKTKRVEIIIHINQDFDNQETGELYNDLIYASASVYEKSNHIYYKYTITNNTNVNIKDFEAFFVFYKNEIPVYISPYEETEIDIGGGTGGFDWSSPEVFTKDGLVNLDFDKIKIVINRARDTK